MEKTENKVCYQGIDIMKFIMALFVMVLHTHPLVDINDKLDFLTANIIGRVAVPFFFSATGFLLEKQMIRQRENVNESSAERTERKIIIQYIKKNLILYCIWTLVYLPIIIYDKAVVSDTTLTYAFFTMIRDFLFTGSYVHLWYLPATAVGLIIVYVFRKYMCEWKCAAILLILFCMGLLTQSYFGLFLKIVSVDSILWKLMKLIKKLMVTCRNGIFFGSFFIYIGTWIARRDMKVKLRYSVTGFIVSIIFFSIEASCLQKIHFVREQDMYLMLIPAAFFLLLSAIQITVKTNTVFLRKMSVNIYFVHMVFKFIYRTFIGEYYENGMRMFMFALCGTFIISYAMYLFERRKMNIHQN